MNEFDNLIFILKSKGMEVLSCFEGTQGKLRFVRYYFSDQHLYGWKDLINRLNIACGDIFEFAKQSEEAECDRPTFSATLTFLTNPSNFEKLEKETAILTYAIEHDEYKTPINYDNRPIFDLKLGMSCNNNCIHCVVKPSIIKMQEQYPKSIILDSGIGMQSMFDLSFDEVINILSQETKDFDKVVLTGGEPTIRNDFIFIIRWLYYNRPNGKVAIQTNGRNFANEDLVKALRRYTRNLSIIIAIHGMEETHNKIVNNRKEVGNPFKETIQGVENLLKVFPITWINTITVMTSLNIEEILESIKFEYEVLGVRRISVIYPDFPNFNKTTIEKLAPSAKALHSVMRKVNEYVGDKKDLSVYFVDIPLCFFNQLGEQINISSFGLDNRKTIVNFLGSQDDNYENYYEDRFEKSSKCSECIFTEYCRGIYKETKDIVEPLMNPINKLTPQLNKVLGHSM